MAIQYRVTFDIILQKERRTPANRQQNKGATSCDSGP